MNRGIALQVALGVACVFRSAHSTAQAADQPPAKPVITRSGSFVPTPGIDSGFAKQLMDQTGAQFSMNALAANAQATRNGALLSFNPGGAKPNGWTAHDSKDPGVLHGLIQLPGPIGTTERKTLKQAGIKLWGRYGSAYAASFAQGTDLKNLLKNGVIRWAGPLGLKAKVQSSLISGKVDAWAKTADGKVRLLIKVFPDVDSELTMEVFGALKVEAVDQHINNVWQVNTEPALIPRLAELDIVQNIEEVPAPPKPLSWEVLLATHVLEAQNASSAPNASTGPSISYKGFAGNSVRVGVADFGIFGAHPDFSTGGQSRVQHPKITALDNSTSPNVHGTHTASIIGGGGAPGNAPPYALRGVAPEAIIADYDPFVAPSTAPASQFEEAVEIEKMDLTNHSYMQSQWGHYDQTAQTLDREIRGDIPGLHEIVRSRPQVWAVGNNGTTCMESGGCAPFDSRFGYFSTYTSAKNSISVGSIDAISYLPSIFSSMGPTDDGRIKPDLVAPGCLDSRHTPWISVRAAEPVNGYYGGLCGTSEAAPVVSGTIALMLDAYRGAKGAGAELESADAKALLVETADEPKPAPAAGPLIPGTGLAVRYGGTPNFVTGFGVVNSNAAVQRVAALDHWVPASNSKGLQQNGDLQQWCLSAGRELKEIKVTLAWDDAEGQPADASTYAYSELVNDLDLTLVSPSGQVYLPWVPSPPKVVGVINGDDSVTPPKLPFFKVDPQSLQRLSRSEDHLNNVEMVRVFGGEVKTGTWKILVKAYDLGVAPQRFALAASEALMPCPAT